MSHQFLDDLRALHTAAIDARSGYEEARDDAEVGGLKPLFQQLIAIHTKNADDLSHVLQRSGVPVGDDGSFMGAVQRTAMSVRSLLGGLGEGVLPGLIDSEKRHAARYDVLLERAGAPQDVRAILVKNRDRLEDEVIRMSALKAQG